MHTTTCIMYMHLLLVLLHFTLKHTYTQYSTVHMHLCTLYACKYMCLHFLSCVLYSFIFPIFSLPVSPPPSGDSEDACPNIVWRCDLLKKMDLSHNRLRTLPDTFKNLRRLNTFTVSYNHLHSLPSSMGLGCINLVS